MSTHAGAETDEVSYVTPTNRDLVFEQLVKQDRIRWTTHDMQQAIDKDISEDTIKHTFNSLAKLGLLRHIRDSPYWYLEPEWF
ncbi:hypothetical protein [Natrinema versiforme]|uniref:MarR family transcriptional regulator n=1 Tax=Natrinema versiforme TaxID=88724 RepID=A0A4P8WK59_9EURY|nr:hypothetical protein [Natrinema versiforme]QCS43899.1 hypothetical protein FEJ81_16665 [Natrinema versiforme]